MERARRRPLQLDADQGGCRSACPQGRADGSDRQAAHQRDVRRRRCAPRQGRWPAHTVASQAVQPSDARRPPVGARGHLVVTMEKVRRRPGSSSRCRPPRRHPRRRPRRRPHRRTCDRRACKNCGRGQGEGGGAEGQGGKERKEEEEEEEEEEAARRGLVTVDDWLSSTSFFAQLDAIGFPTDRRASLAQLLRPMLLVRRRHLDATSAAAGRGGDVGGGGGLGEGGVAPLDGGALFYASEVGGEGGKRGARRPRGRRGRRGRKARGRSGGAMVLCDASSAHRGLRGPGRLGASGGGGWRPPSIRGRRRRHHTRWGWRRRRRRWRSGVCDGGGGRHCAAEEEEEEERGGAASTLAAPLETAGCTVRGEAVAGVAKLVGLPAAMRHSAQPTHALGVIRSDAGEPLCLAWPLVAAREGQEDGGEDGEAAGGGNGDRGGGSDAHADYGAPTGRGVFEATRDMLQGRYMLDAPAYRAVQSAPLLADERLWRHAEERVEASRLVATSRREQRQREEREQRRRQQQQPPKQQPPPRQQQQQPKAKAAEPPPPGASAAAGASAAVAPSSARTAGLPRVARCAAHPTTATPPSTRPPRRRLLPRPGIRRDGSWDASRTRRVGAGGLH